MPAVDRTSRIGQLYASGIARLQGLRRIPVKGFEKYLLFNLPHENGIDVIRVFHAARDIEQAFDDDEF